MRTGEESGGEVKPNGRRRWRKWKRDWMRRHNRRVATTGCALFFADAGAPQFSLEFTGRFGRAGQPLGSICSWSVSTADAKLYRRHAGRVYDGHKKTIRVTPGELPQNRFDSRSLVGMTMGARKRAASGRLGCDGGPGDEHITKDRTQYRIGQPLRSCPGCKECGYESKVKLWTLRRGLWCFGSLGVRDIKRICDGSGILPARKAAK